MLRNSWEYILFVCLGVLGFFLARDYGTCMDAGIQRLHGIRSYEYIFEDGILRHPQYGVFFSLPMFILEKLFGWRHPNIYFARHVAAHWLFLLSCVAFFRISIWLGRGKAFGLIGLCVYMLSPRIFAHSFMNPKDTVLLSLMTIFFWSLSRILRNPSIGNLLLMAICVGSCIAMRLQGIVAISYGVLAIALLVLTKQLSVKRAGLMLPGYLLAVSLVTYALWPSLWENPFTELPRFFGLLNKNQWKGTNYFFGEVYRLPNRDHTVIFGWMLVTIPCITLFLSATSLVCGSYKLFQGIVRSFRKKLQLETISPRALFLFIVGVSLLGPIFGILVLKTNTYSGWRHLYFLHFSVACLAVHGLITINSYPSLSRTALRLLCGLLFLAYGKIFMEIVRYHPFQHVYFNEFITLREKNFAKMNFELDYWRVSYFPALKKILEVDPRANLAIRLYGGNPGSARLIGGSERERFRIIRNKAERTDYMISNFRYQWRNRDHSGFHKVYSFFAFNSEIAAIYSMHPKEVTSFWEAHSNVED